MSRKEVRRRQPSGSFFMPSPIPPEGTSRGWPVIPHSDAGSREYRPWSADLFIITFFSLPNRPRCGHPIIPHFDAGSREYRQRSSRTFGKLIPHFFIITFLVCSIAPDAVSQSSRTPMRDPENTGKFTRKILFPGPSIAVRGDTVLDAESRI